MATPGAPVSSRCPESRGIPGDVRAEVRGKAEKTFNLIREWEKSAVLSDTQVAALEEIGDLCSTRPLPADLPDDATLPLSPRASLSSHPDAPRGQDSVSPRASGKIETAHDFLEWFAHLETSREAESDRRFAAHADKLRNVIQACDDAAALTDNVAQLMSDVLDTCHTVRSTIHGLDSACNRLVGERDEVEAFLAALRRRLVHFDRIDDLSSRLASAAVSRLDPNDLLDAIRELEEALAFLRESTGLADSQTYLSRARQLEARLLAHARFRSQAVLQQAAASAQEEARSQEGAHGAAQWALQQAKFRSVAEVHLKGLLTGLETMQENSTEIARLLKEIRANMCTVRLESLRPALESAVAAMQAAAIQRGHDRAAQGEPPRPDIVGFTSEAISLLALTLRRELSLLSVFFPAAASSDPRGCLEALVGPLEMPVYERVRGAVVGMASVPELCGIVDVLLREAAEGEGAEVVGVLVDRMLADAQERLTFRCQAFLRDRVVGYVPSEEDIRAFDGIREGASMARREDEMRVGSEGDGEGKEKGEGSVAGEGGVALPSEGDRGQVPSTSGDTMGQEGEANGRLGWRREVLYAPVRATLHALESMDGRLPPSVFGGLAEEGISGCLSSLSLLRSRLEPTLGPLEGGLAVLMNLYAIRDRLAEFGEDVWMTDIELNFYGMRSQLQRLFAGEYVTALTGAGATLWEILSSGFDISHRVLNPRAELDRQLKQACEDVIMAAMRSNIGPLLHFLTSVTAAQVTGGGSASLRDLEFAKPDAVATVVAAANRAMQEEVPCIARLLKAYLAVPEARRVISGPLKANLSEALGQMAAVVFREYTAEEADAMALMSPDEVKHALALLD